MFPGAVDISNVDGGMDFDSQYMSEDELPDPAAELTTEDKIYLAMKWGRLYKPNEWVILEQKYEEALDNIPADQCGDPGRDRSTGRQNARECRRPCPRYLRGK